MNKKIIAIVLTLALPLTVAAFPVDPGNIDAHSNAKIERLTKKLDLSAEQKTKVEAIFKEQHEKLRGIHEETRTRIQAILSKEQIAKMDEMKKQHHEKSQKKPQALPNSTDPGQKK